MKLKRKGFLKVILMLGSWHLRAVVCRQAGTFKDIYVEEELEDELDESNELCTPCLIRQKIGKEMGRQAHWTPSAGLARSFRGPSAQKHGQLQNLHLGRRLLRIGKLQTSKNLSIQKYTSVLLHVRLLKFSSAKLPRSFPSTFRALPHVQSQCNPL